MKRILRLLLVEILLHVAQSAENPYYNVLIVVVDDLRTEIGSYRTNSSDDYKVAFTPNLDKFAKKSVQFDRAYAQVSLCGPSRASTFTGRTARSLDYFQHNLNDLDDAAIISRSPIATMPKYFQSKGFKTVGAGKVFHRDANLNQFQNSLASSSAACPCSTALNNCPMMTCTVADSKKSTLSDYPVVQFGLDYLDKFKASGENFFMSLGIRKPHLPYDVPESNLQKIKTLYGANLQKMPIPNPSSRSDPYSVANYYCDGIDAYLNAVISASSTPRSVLRTAVNDEIYIPDFKSENDYFLPANLTTTKTASSRAATSVSTNLGAEAIDDSLIKQVKLGYFAAVNWADELFGMIDAKLENLGLYENTVVVVFGDNGFSLGEQGQYCKNSNYEASARVPLYIKHPKGKTGIIKSEIVSLLDLYPTILDLASKTSTLPKPTELQGTSLKNLVMASSANSKSVKGEIERVAFSGVNRCWDEAGKTFIICNKVGDVTVMGYSVRSLNYRYTEWRDFDMKNNFYTFSGRVIVRELYNHTNSEEPSQVELDNLVKSAVPAGIFVSELVSVLSNMLEAHFACEDTDCVPITSTFSPTGAPTTLSPTTFPSESPTELGDTPAPTVHQTKPPTFPLNPENNASSQSAAMSAAISIVIMLACVAIAVIVIVWTKKQRADKLRAERSKQRKSPSFIKVP